MYPVLVLVLYVLAVARLTRLVNHDVILDSVRVRVERRKWTGVQYFLGCPWCVGLWLSMAASPMPILVIGLQWWWALPLGLACSYLIGVLAPLSYDEDIAIEAVDAD